jgi:magnesium-transporting ATPase (P-type)
MDAIPGTEQLVGLTQSEANQCLSAGEANRTTRGSDRTIGDIVRSNVFTRFNAILGSLLIIILTLGPAVDGLFGVILVANVLIGIVQEVRAKRTLDHLLLITATTSTVLRDGQPVEVAPTDVVRGDVVGLRSGSQVIVDGPVVASNELEVDESLLTGESEPQARAIGDQLRSGSFVTAGTGWFRAEKVGDQSFANALSNEARKFAPVQSELRAVTDSVLKVVTWAIGPIAAALLIGQRVGGETWNSAIFGSATGVVEIVPEGFVLLTSMTLAMSVVRLGRRGVLVKELAAVEGLARVDTICFDKTGTLTEGDPVVDAIVDSNGKEETESSGDAYAVLRALTINSANSTSKAIATFVSDKTTSTSSRAAGEVVPFNSTRKWAALTSSSITWVMGAPEIVLGPESEANAIVLKHVAAEAALGKRVLVLASTTGGLPTDGLPPDLAASVVITLIEKMRTDAVQTLQYFAKQGVEVKIISGDNPTTVAAIARAAGMEGLDATDAIVDARTIADSDALTQMIPSARIIGRSTPQQKQTMVVALKDQGKTVAMTGDGVNDALALKVSDLAVAMGSGSEATRAVAQLVLIDGGFSNLPVVVDEGRRVIANVERVAKLFLTKTMYAALLAVATGVARIPFPFLPRQLTLVSALTIGIPGFFLAFVPDSPPTKAGFKRRITEFSVPAGLTAAIATFAVYLTALHTRKVSIGQSRTAATVALGIIGLWIVSVLARPLTKWRDLLLATMSTAGVLSVLVPASKTFWKLDYPPLLVIGEAMAITAAGIATIEVGWRLATHRRPVKIAKTTGKSALGYESK